MAKKEIKFFQSFEELEADDLRMNMEMTLQERWDTFWNLRKLHDELFGKSDPTTVDGKKRIIISKPEWISGDNDNADTDRNAENLAIAESIMTGY